MYRLMLYYLIILVAAAAVVFRSVNIIFEALFLVAFCYLVNKIFSKIFSAPTNFESFAITALILSLIVGPTLNFFLLIIVATLAMASKYLLVINRRHLFNPAALAVVLSAIFLHQTASWWVGTDAMAIPIILGGLLVLKKIRRFTLALIFILSYLVLNPTSFFSVPSSPILFFVFVMLVEPLTSPVITRHQIIYAIFVAVAFKFLPVPYSLELSLILGNALAYLLAPTGRFLLQLEHQLPLSESAHALYFQPDKKLSFLAGQYLELTLPHPHPDSRGVRRFFTIASSPTEPEVMITSKFVAGGSTFKKTLLAMSKSQKLFANGPAGEFVLPKNPYIKLAFVAGGIGITPFRSMAKFLADREEKRDIVLLYAASSDQDFLFKDLFPKAIYKVGHLEEEDVKRGVPDYKQRLFYVSGPEPMVEATTKILREQGIPPWRIKRDFFPGYQA